MSRMTLRQWNRIFLFLPVLAAYLFFGSPNEADAAEAIYSAHEHHSTGGALEDGLSIGKAVGNTLFYTVRSLYYFMLLLAAGMMLLHLAIPASSKGDGQRALLNKYSGAAMRGLLLTTLLFVFLHANKMINDLGGSGENWIRLFTETSAGRSWLMLVVLALIGFAVLKLPDLVKAIWALLLLAAESFNGHVAASEHASTAIILDYIHLVCSAIWAGGVMLLLLFWRSDRKEAGRFAERFASIAWMTIVALVASGVAMTWLLLPSWLYLIYTDWGIWLLAKALILSLVVVTGAALRYRARRKEMPRGALLKLDGWLMAAIVVIASIFTYISPQPDSSPLIHHQMGEDLHYTMKLSPNAPGPNEVSLTVWLPENSGEPRSIQLSVMSIDRPERKELHIPLVQIKSEGGIAFPGFDEYRFTGDELTLPHRGEWKAKLVMIDGLGAELVREIDFVNE